MVKDVPIVVRLRRRDIDIGSHRAGQSLSARFPIPERQQPRVRTNPGAVRWQNQDSGLNGQRLT